MEKQEIGKNKKSSAYAGFTKVDAPVIHTMPRRFINAKAKTSTNHKGTGLLIVGVGFIVLVAGIIFSYLYIFKSSTISNALVQNGIKDPAATAKNDGVLEQKSSDNAAVQGSQVNEENEKKANDEETGGETNILSEKSEQQNVDEGTTTEAIETASSSPILTIDIDEEAENEIAVKSFQPAPDADSDGVSDSEEAILKTSATVADSDNDGYTDLSEIENLYNPAGNGKLIVNSEIEKYSSKESVYSLLYPKNWTISDTNSPESAIFRISSTQFVQIVIVENQEKISLTDWYKEQFKISNIENNQKVYKSGWEGVKNAEGLIYYLSKPEQDKVYVINYNVGDDTVLYFKNLFMMMVNSFELQQ